jgi:hypothetical protein
VINDALPLNNSFHYYYKQEKINAYSILAQKIKHLEILEGKVVPVLPLTEHHAMKAYWGVELQLHPFFDLDTRRR